MLWPWAYFKKNMGITHSQTPLKMTASLPLSEVITQFHRHKAFKMIKTQFFHFFHQHKIVQALLSCSDSIQEKCIMLEMCSRRASSSGSWDHMEIVPHTKCSTNWIHRTGVTYLIKAGCFPLD